jgi:hypothetical protein
MSDLLANDRTILHTIIHFANIEELANNGQIHIMPASMRAKLGH